jgi:hypothetical protein
LTKETISMTVRVKIHYITHCLQSEGREPLNILAPESSIELRNAVQELDTIGWKFFLKGRLTQQWETTNIRNMGKT